MSGRIQGILHPQSVQFWGVGAITDGPIFNFNDTCVQLVSLVLPPGFKAATQPKVTVDGETHSVLAQIDNSNPLNINKNAYMQLFRPMAAYYKNGWQFIPLGLYVVYDGISTYLIISSQFQSDEALQLINGPMFLRGRLL